MIRHLNVTLLLLIVSVTLSSCSPVCGPPPFPKDYYEEKEFTPKPVVTIQDASINAIGLKRENKRLVAKIQSLSPY